jgi:NTE family protein
MLKKKKQKCPKIGLAFSGGSALGIAHIGAIKALRENKIPIDCVSGTSAGAIVATALAFGVPLEKMIKLSCRLSWSNLSEFGYSKLGLNSNGPVGEIMIELVGDKKIEDALMPLAIIATNVDTGEKIIFRKGSVAEAVRASTCLPGFFIPTEIGGKKLVDGGLVENLPLSPLQKMGADVRIGIDLGHFRTLKKTRNILDVITNSYNILIKPQEKIPAEDVEVLIEPHLEKFHSTDFEKVDELMQAGYQATKLKIPQIKKYLGRKIKPEPKSFWQQLVDFFRK